eukprot:SAG22_NODE_959_length_6298_cov_3.186159_3_plen_248_part_00
MFTTGLGFSATDTPAGRRYALVYMCTTDRPMQLLSCSWEAAAALRGGPSAASNNKDMAAGIAQRLDAAGLQPLLEQFGKLEGTGTRWVYYGRWAEDADLPPRLETAGPQPEAADVILPDVQDGRPGEALWMWSLRHRLEFFLAEPVCSFTLNEQPVVQHSPQQLLELLMPLPSFGDPKGFLDRPAAPGFEGLPPAFGVELGPVAAGNIRGHLWERWNDAGPCEGASRCPRWRLLPSSAGKINQVDRI